MSNAEYRMSNIDMSTFRNSSFDIRHSTFVFDPEVLVPTLLVTPLLLVTCLISPTTSKPPSFAAFVDAYFDSLFAFSPSLGTAAGLHQYDTRLEDRTAARIGRRIGTLRGQL